MNPRCEKSKMAKKPKFKFRICSATDPDNILAWFWECDRSGITTYSDGPFYSIEKASEAVLTWAFECYGDGGYDGDEFGKKDKDLMKAMVEMGEDMERSGRRAVFGYEIHKNEPKRLMRV